MPRKSEIERMAEAAISRLESNIRKLDEQAMKQRAEIKAYKNLIDWDKKMRQESIRIRKEKKEKGNSNEPSSRKRK